MSIDPDGELTRDTFFDVVETEVCCVVPYVFHYVVSVVESDCACVWYGAVTSHDRYLTCLYTLPSPVGMSFDPNTGIVDGMIRDFWTEDVVVGSRCVMGCMMAANGCPKGGRMMCYHGCFDRGAYVT